MMNAVNDKKIFKEAYCPSCGRFIGPREKCPFCGAEIKERIRLKYIKVLALVLAIVGVFGIFLFSKMIPVPTVKIADIDASYNYAPIRVKGYVIEYPDYNEESESITFWIMDETGEIMVKAYRDAARELIKQGKIPGVMDYIDCIFEARITRGFKYLIIEVPDYLTIYKPEPEQLTITQIIENNITMKKAIVEGVITSVRSYSSGYGIWITDGEYELEIWVPISQLSFFSNHTDVLDRIAPGMKVIVKGGLKLYRGSPEIVPDSLLDIQIIEE